MSNEDVITDLLEGNMSIIDFKNYFDMLDEDLMMMIGGGAGPNTYE